MSWAIEEKGYSQRRACGLIGLEPKTYRSASSRGDDAAVRVTMNDTAPNGIERAKREALAELHGDRERLRIEREAKARADLTAEQEIAAAINRRREEAAKEGAVRAEMKEFWAKRDADLAAQAAAER